MLMVQATTEPDKAGTLKEACLAVTDALAETGVTEEEVARLREPVLRGLRDAQRQNGYWLGALHRTLQRRAPASGLRERSDFGSMWPESRSRSLS